MAAYGRVMLNRGGRNSRFDCINTNIAFTNRVKNSVDPDQLASEKPADLDAHCFQNLIYPGSMLSDEMSIFVW